VRAGVVKKKGDEKKINRGLESVRCSGALVSYQMRRCRNQCEIAKCYSYVTALFRVYEIDDSKKPCVYAAFLVELGGFEPPTF
jgi:hypothetical protein